MATCQKPTQIITKNMKLTTFTKLALALAMLAPAPAAITAEAKKRTRRTVTRRTVTSSKYKKYTGKIGKAKVTVFLNDACNGYYYYGNGSKGKLTLRGKYIEPGGSRNARYHLYEYNAAGKQTAVWDVYIGYMWVDVGQYEPHIEGEMTTSSGISYDVNLW